PTGAASCTESSTSSARSWSPGCRRRARGSSARSISTGSPRSSPARPRHPRISAPSSRDACHLRRLQSGAILRPRSHPYLIRYGRPLRPCLACSSRAGGGGARLEAALSHVYCPECGFQNLESANYCARCGALLVTESEPDDPTVTLSAAEVEEASGAALEEVGVEGPTLVVRSGGGRTGEQFPLERM